MTTKYNFECAVTDLQLGDVIRVPSMPDAPWNTGIVKNVSEGRIEIFRPYGTTADFTYTGGVICYTGIEQFPILPCTGERVWVYQRTKKA